MEDPEFFMPGMHVALRDQSLSSGESGVVCFITYRSTIVVEWTRGQEVYIKVHDPHDLVTLRGSSFSARGFAPTGT